jgi:hypothetical protein
VFFRRLHFDRSRQQSTHQRPAQYRMDVSFVRSATHFYGPSGFDSLLAVAAGCTLPWTH